MQHARRSRQGIRRSDSAPLFGLPADYTGLATVPGSGRLIYWTGKIAIGLQYEKPVHTDIGTQAEFVQRALLKSAAPRLAAL